MTAHVLTVAVGVPFDIELGAGPTTGYAWEPASPPPGVRITGHAFRQAPTSAIGDGGVQVFHVQADQSGRFELLFQLKRRWEATPIKTHSVEVDAH